MLEVTLLPSDITPFFQHGCHLKLGRNSFRVVPSTLWADTHIPVTGMYTTSMMRLLANAS